MIESDWKVFKKIKEQAIESFCNRALDEFRELIDDNQEPSHNRYLLLYRLVENRDKQMSLLFDNHSRSKATLQLMGIRAEGLANEKMLSELSPKFLEQTDPKAMFVNT